MKQEISRKMGYSIQAEEEQLRVQLEKIQLELNHPTQFKVQTAYELLKLFCCFNPVLFKWD